MKLRDCMSPRFLPVFFIKLGMRPLARLMLDYEVGVIIGKN